jgi:CRP/FNR family transcriptional regulator, cyclic AMP receptor protein
MTEIDLTSESLRSIPMFAGLDEMGLFHVSQIATEVKLPAGHVLMQPGTEGQGLFVILDGCVNVELPGSTTITCNRGEFIGELSLLVEGLEHTGRVRAAGDVTCLAISRDEFARLLADYPQIAVPMLSVLAQRLANTDAMLKAQ